jgi:hypothetical protein
VVVGTAWSSNEWAQAVADLPRTGPLPVATVLVPRPAIAHALRKELVQLGRRDVLAGTLFVGARPLATEVLFNAGRVVREREEELRSARLRALFRTGLVLRYFDLDLLRDTQGWDTAFARTIGDLEAAGLDAEHLAMAAGREGSSEDAARLGDVAAIWRAANEAAGESWTHARILLEAARLLERDVGLWPNEGPTLAAVTGHEPSAEARFLKAIPRVQFLALAARPIRTVFLEECGANLGLEVARAFRESTPPPASTTERSLLQSHLFDSGEALVAARARSQGPDGTVDLEEHAGFEEEIEAAVDWVARLVYERAAPLEEIGLLLTELDPGAAMLAERLAERGIACHVSGGVPACATAAGARALAVVRALREYLGFEALAEVLPTLRCAADADEDGADQVRRLSRGEARELAFGLGTVGGSPGHPEGALEWPGRLRARRASIEAAIAEAEADPASDDARESAARLRQAKVLGQIEPALAALVDLARASIRKTPLRELAPATATFLSEWLLAPGAGRAVVAAFGHRAEQLASDSLTGSLVGDDALAALEELLVAGRVPVGRWGEASVHVDTVERAAGVPFGALRMIGLAEGTLPSPPREDAVLPERVRASLGAPGLARSGRVTLQLHAFDRVVRDARGSIVLSAPRLSADRTYREPSSIFIEVATSLGRPNRVTGKHEGLVPTGRALRRDGFLPARDVATAFRRSVPLSEAAWHDRVASFSDGPTGAQPDDVAIVPERWNTVPMLDLRRVMTLRGPGFGSLDGLLGPAAQGLGLPGLSAERPLSASALALLLECPHRFLFERGFHWNEPRDAPNARELDALSYGTLFHAVAETFFVAHGGDFGGRRGKLSDWHVIADRLANEAFDAFVEEYPLTGDAVREAQRERLRADLRALLEHEHREPEARFIEAERSFGTDEPLALQTSAGAIYLVGYIDRVDVGEGKTRVRDLKTGKAHHRRQGDPPDAKRDVQIALYALVARHLAKQWALPSRVSAQYVYANARGVELRDWDGEMDALLAVANEWLELGDALLRSGNLPRTPNEGDCTYCPFTAVCGEDRNTRAEALLEKRKILRPFRILKEQA